MTHSTQRRLLLKSIVPASGAVALGSLGLLSGCGGSSNAGDATGVSGHVGGSSGASAASLAECLPPLPIEPIDAAATLSKIADGSLFEFNDDNQADIFRHVDLLHTTRPIAQNRCRATALAQDTQRDLNAMRYAVNGEQRGIEDFMVRHRTAGLLIMKDGRIALERYGMGQTAASKWTSFSLTKSFMSTLVGAAVQDGHLQVSDPVRTHLHPAAAGPYADVTVEQLLRMRSGIPWTDLSEQGMADLGTIFESALSKEGRRGDSFIALTQLMRDLPRDTGPAAFRYSTADSIVLGEVVHAATGRPLNDYLREKVWEPAGMDWDGYWLAESPEGLEFGGAGISATLRDFARFGQFILSGAKHRDGRAILPARWAEQAYLSGPDGSGKFIPAFEESPDGYGYQWWVVDQSVSERAADARPIFYASGLMGQRIFIDPVNDVVMVVLRALPLFDLNGSQRDAENLAVLNEAIRQLR